MVGKGTPRSYCDGDAGTGGSSSGPPHQGSDVTRRGGHDDAGKMALTR